MRRLLLLLGCAATSTLAACGDDNGTGNASAVDITVSTIRTATDTATAQITLDDTLTFTVKGDSVINNVPSGQHRFAVVTTEDYLPYEFTQTVNRGSRNVVILRPPTCRIVTSDVNNCINRSLYGWQGHNLIFCPGNDYGAFCTVITDGSFLGMTWPDSNPDFNNSYNFHSKLMIGAIRDGAAGGDDTLATAFYAEGDFAPRERLHAFQGDSSRWRNLVWTDARHTRLAGSDTTLLRDTDRPGENFGLEVAITGYLPPSEPNAILFKFDVRNISATPEYQFFHPEEPATGHTLRELYLTPFFDPDIGGGDELNGAVDLDRAGDVEAHDDNATFFPAESLLVAYDETFSVGNFSLSYASAPGLFGVQVIETPAGTSARGVVLTDSVSQTEKYLLTFSPPAREDSLFAYYSAGRAGAQLVPSTCRTSSFALICAPETPNNVRAGWSIGPIPTLAPGQSVSLTVAIILAEPKSGSFTSTTAVQPDNDNLASTTRQIFDIAELLRTRAQAVRALRVP